jgi:hypothetical protein
VYTAITGNPNAISYLFITLKNQPGGKLDWLFLPNLSEFNESHPIPLYSI